MEGVASQLHKMRRTGVMCDIVIRSNNNRQHRAHSIMLAAASPVFKVMVTKEFKEKQTKEIKLHDANSEIVELLLDYIYTGAVSITNNNVVDIFQAAHQFQLAPLLTSCKTYMKQHMDASNCYGILKLGERFANDDLVTKSLLYLHQHFEEFSSSEDFYDLSFEELQRFLKHDQLCLDREEMIIDLIFKWINHSYESRNSRLVDLLRCARYALMDSNYITTSLKNDPRLQGNYNVEEFTATVTKACYNMFHRCTPPPTTMGYLTLRYRIPKQLVYLVGGWTRGRTLDVAECFNCCSNEWYVTKHLQDPKGGRCYFGMELLQEHVYVLGGYCGKMYMNTVRKFDTNTRQWSDVAPMHYRRCFTTSCLLNDEIYVIGGYDGTRRLTTVEKYSSLNNQWVQLQSLNTPRSDCASVVHNRKIYLFGGYGGDALCTCEEYDIQTDKWNYLMQMQTRRSGACAISLPRDNKIIILGGYNGHQRVRTTEIYDPETNSWTYGPPMLRERSNFTAFVLKKKLFVIGGYTGHVTLSDVECLDLEEPNKWVKSGDINCGRSAMKAVILDDLSNMKDYFEGAEQINTDGSRHTIETSWPQEINLEKVFNKRMKRLHIE